MTFDDIIMLEVPSAMRPNNALKLARAAGFARTALAA
jgi:hypothetical protein